MKKFISILVAMLLVLSTTSVMVGCSDNTSVDDTKSQFVVGLQESGYGRDWMDAIIEDFETAYAGEVFEEGKKGVQVQLNYKPDAYTSTMIKANIKENEEEVYCVNLLTYSDFYSRNTQTSDYLLDITDIVTEGENSIFSRMSDIDQKYFNIGTADSPKLFALPFEEYVYAMYYDKDLFEERGYYTLKEYKGLDCIDGNEDDLAGPDGKMNTVDDGMPATFEDFKALVNVMVRNGVTPFVWSGKEDSYRRGFLNSVLASYEGKDSFAMRYNWEGEYNGETIDMYNAYKLASQEGVKAMLEFADFITSSPSYYTSSSTTVSTHIEAQNEFLSNGTIFSSAQPVGFLIEGSWWEHEAWETLADREAAGFNNNFGMMPIPKFIGTSGIKDQTNQYSVFSSAGTSGQETAIFASKTAKHPEIAKAFIKFFYQEEQLATFTTMTGLFIGDNITLTDEQYNGLTALSKQRYDYKKSENTQDFRLRISNPYYLNYGEYLKSWSCGNLNNKLDALKGLMQEGVSVQTYLDEYAAQYNAAMWPIKK